MPRRPQRRDRQEETLPKLADQLQYLGGIMAVCYLERQYRKGEDPGFLLIALGAAAIGVCGLGGILGDASKAYI